MSYLQIYGLLVIAHWLWILYLLLRDEIEFVKEKLDENVVATLAAMLIVITLTACVFPIWWVMKLAGKARRKRKEKEKGNQ